MIAPPGPARVAVVGSGAWGTTLAAIIARREPVILLCRSAATAKVIAASGRNEARLPGIDLPPELRATADPAALVEATDVVLFAVPSRHLRETVARVAEALAPTADLVSVTKGLEAGTLRRMSEILTEEAGADGERVVALSGPNLAPEIARGLPASAVVAGREGPAARVQRRLGRRRFRLYVNEDIVGVELGGALKNVIAIAAGAVDELGFGDNGKAGLMTRGLAEMTRLGIAAGANPLTFAGLAGLGDVIATCGSPLSRNHRLGVELARGRRWADIEASLPGVAEGAYTVDAAIALGDRHGVELPIAAQVHAALYEGKPVVRCLVDLLAREQKDELADYRAWVSGLGRS